MQNMLQYFHDEHSQSEESNSQFNDEHINHQIFIQPQQPIQYLQNMNADNQNIQRKQRLKEFSNSLIKNDPKYIADNLYAVQIIQELTNAGVCKISTIVNGDYSSIQEQIIKYDKVLQSADQQSKSAFFINAQPFQIVYQNGEIVFKQIQSKLKIQEGYDQKYIYLIQVINLTTTILDPSFIKEFQLLIDLYIKYSKEKNNSQQKIVETLCNLISQNNQQEFLYMQKWLEVKTKYKPVIVIYKQIKILEKKDELCARKSPKVLQKYSKKIEKLQQKLYSETILSPLEFLLTNLFQIFEKILTYYEQNRDQLYLIKKQQQQTKNEMKIEKQVQQNDFLEKKCDENLQNQQNKQQQKSQYIIVDDEKDENLLENPPHKKIKENPSVEKLQ